MVNSKILGLSFVALLSASAYAEGEATSVNVTTLAKSAHLGLQYRAAYIYNDNKISKLDGQDDPPKTSMIAPEVAKMVIKGDLTGDSNYKATYNFMKNKVEYFKFTWMPVENLGIELGQDKVKQAGFEALVSAPFAMVNSHYYDYNLPFEHYAPVLGLTYKVAGKVSLQMVNDTAGPSSTYPEDRDYQKTYSQPGTILEYAGEFGAIKPLLQIGVYDLGKSKYYTLGVMFAQDGLSADVNYTMDQRAEKVGNDAKTHNLSNIVLNASYAMGSVEPFFKFTMYDAKQHTSDAKGNGWTAVAATATTPAAIVNDFSDNGQNILIGSYVLSQGNQLKPYAGVLMTSAKFYKDGSGAATETETRSNMKLMVGAAGEF